MFHHLPPVGNRIVLGNSGFPIPFLAPIFAPYNFHFFGSGTMALAAALLAAKKIKQENSPEVIIPAYTCPDLASAALHAQIKPVLVDLEENTPWLDLAQLSGKINKHTIAVIVVNLFGIPERIAKIRELGGRSDFFVIEDAAQSFPKDNQIPLEHGDFVILSFGRGKPVSVLEGGAVLHTDKNVARYLPRPVINGSPRRMRAAAFRLRIALHNMFLSPHLFGIVSKLPFLEVGITRFKPLKEITRAETYVISALASNISLDRSSSRAAQDGISAMVARLRSEAILDLARTCGADNLPCLLRYPLLMLDPRLRDHAFRQLHEAGLGVSRMYPSPLTAIPGLERLLESQGPFPNAEKFSKTIITLPTHCGLKRKHVDTMETIITDLTKAALDRRRGRAA